MGICRFNKLWDYGLYTALGGLAAVLVSVPPVREAWQVGGFKHDHVPSHNCNNCNGTLRYVLKNFKKSNKKNIGIGSNYC